MSEVVQIATVRQRIHGLVLLMRASEMIGDKQTAMLAAMAIRQNLRVPL